MQILYLHEAKPQNRQAIALGYFDGGHIGHAKILHAARNAISENCESAVFSFPTLPTKSGAPLLSLDDRLAFFEKNGIQNVFLAPFDCVRDLSATAFLEEILITRLHACKAFCGFNYRFGKGAEGDASLLCRLLPESTVFPPTLYEGAAISATRIRTALLSGEVENAAQMLGRYYAVKGEVIHGDARGRTIGIPTANVIPCVLLPRFGVYKTEVRFDGRVFKGLSDVGVRPTVTGDNTPRIETHIPDFSGDLYGKQIEISFLSFLREEKKFSSLDELRAQIALDIQKL